MEIKTKINKWGLMKLKSFCTTKESVKMKRPSSEWEKIFANEEIDKGLISKIYKQLMQLNIKNQVKALHNTPLDTALPTRKTRSSHAPPVTKFPRRDTSVSLPLYF